MLEAFGEESRVIAGGGFGVLLRRHYGSSSAVVLRESGLC